jgi:hypothetical protein
MLKTAAVGTIVAAATFVAPAQASQLIGRNATHVALRVNEKQALVTFRAGGAAKKVLVWGAVNARPPQTTAPQVKFHVNYTGFGFAGGTCKPYTGPSLPWFVAGCDGPDGSYWAAQSFPQPLPDLGFTPWLPAQRDLWLNISHWTGPIPQLEVAQDWVWGGKFREIYGQLSYLGVPVYGFGTTRYGVPTGGYGTLIYLDVLNAPAYGAGWRRENSFVPHKPSGVFCYGFYTFDPTKGGYRHPPGWTKWRGPGTGTKYRIFAEGPGVTPDVSVVVPGSHEFDRSNPEDLALQQEESSRLAAWGDRKCRAGH